MKRIALISSLLCVAGVSMAKSPVETYGPLAVNGNKLVDSTGASVTLRGMSLFWHYDKGGKEFWVPSAMKWAMTDWHASVIRAPIGVEDHTSAGYTFKGQISDPANANDYITRAIEGAIEYGFYVIVDWHAHQVHTNEAKAWFGGLAKKYGNTPNIIWEIFNEPNGPGWGEIASYANAVIPEIRKYSNNVILVGSSSWSANPQEAGTELNKYPNIAYTIHFYSDHSWTDRIQSAMSNNHAVFASEFGLSSSSGDGGFVPTTSGNSAAWLSAMNSAGVSHCNWSLGNPLGSAGTGTASETSAALNQGVSYTGGWDPAKDLTESGKSIRSYLISKNPAWTVSDTALRMLSPLAITSDLKTKFVLTQDSIEFSAGFSKDVNWVLTETGRTSTASFGALGTGKSVSASHLVGQVKRGSKAFQPGETVDVTLTPLAQKLSYTISTSTGVMKRVRETNIQWVGSRLSLPGNLIARGERVVVELRNSQGQIAFQTAAIMGSDGRIDLSERPRTSGVQILDITAPGVVVRARMAPNF